VIALARRLVKIELGCDNRTQTVTSKKLYKNGKIKGEKEMSGGILRGYSRSKNKV
jgi:hypothetical protein